VRRWSGERGYTVFRTYGIQRKLVLAIVIVLLLLLGGLGLAAVKYMGDMTRSRVYGAALRNVNIGARRIVGFLSERSRIVLALTEDPQLLDWAEARNSDTRDLGGDRDYRQLIEYLRRLTDSDPMVLSTFFALNGTGEYFREDGKVVPVEGYDARTRPWWKDAVREDRLYVAEPITDLDRGTVSVTVQTTFRNDDGALLGVAGVDVLLTTVGEVVNQTKYEGEGVGFLIGGDGKIVYHPDVKVGGDGASDRPMAGEVFADGKGFSGALQRMQGGEKGLDLVTWKGKRYYLFFAPVVAHEPAMNWSLGLLIPEGVVSGPINRVRLTSMLGVLLIIGIVTMILISLTSSMVVQPVNRLVERFRDIASGKGDLTHTVEVDSQDELGELGSLFNTFMAGIREDISSVATLSETLAGASDHLFRLSQQIASATEETSSQAGMVSAAAEQVSTNVQSVATATEEMSSSIREIARSTSDAARVANEAVVIADDTVHRFDELMSSGDKIAQVVEVIRTIADQTNLLALNASIEAARAGEAGKGFAVVAGEVKALANQTSEATGEIESSVLAIRKFTMAAGEAIEKVTEIIGKINEIQTVIASAVEQQSATTSEIGQNVAEAARGVDDIARSIASFAEVAQETASGASSIQESAESVAETAAQLKAIVGRFRF